MSIIKLCIRFCAIIACFIIFPTLAANKLPYIAIVNYGPHSSLHDTIEGIKDGLEKHGFIDGKTVKISVEDVNFDSTLISQMVTKAKASNPDIVIAVTTPVAQSAKNIIKDIPILFTVVTDPLEAKLLKEANQANGNITGTSDRQDLSYVLTMARKLLPTSDTVGLMYSTAEANDAALLKMMKEAVIREKIALIAVPIDQMRDVTVRMQQFNKLADFIYVGTSGPIQPALPSISAVARNMEIPVFNADPEAVKKHQVLASFGVRYYRIGLQTANMAVKLLQGGEIATMSPVYPTLEEHQAFISAKQMQRYHVHIPEGYSNITIVE